MCANIGSKFVNVLNTKPQGLELGEEGDVASVDIAVVGKDLRGDDGVQVDGGIVAGGVADVGTTDACLTLDGGIGGIEVDVLKTCYSLGDQIVEVVDRGIASGEP